MKMMVYSSKSYDQISFTEANKHYGFDVEFLPFKLDRLTVEFSKHADAVCIFVNDDCNEEIIKHLSELGIKLILLRCAGFNNIDLEAAKKYNVQVARVPSYSPQSVAEHALALILSLNRKIHRAYNRTREGNFSLDGFIGFNLANKTIGVIGTGKIGQAMIQILQGFGATVLCYDPYPIKFPENVKATYVPLDEIYTQSDIITLHCPLTPDSHYLLNAASFAKMKQGIMIINTSRGALLKTNDALECLNTGQIGALGMDVYESERELFFEDKSNDIITDDTFRRLSSYNNVLLTGHQAFLTHEALGNISSTTFENAKCFFAGEKCNSLVELDN